MARMITISINDDLAPEQYADLANAVWMFMRNTPYDFDIAHDGKTDTAELNTAWDQYGKDASWE